MRPDPVRSTGSKCQSMVYVTRLDSSLYWLVADAGDTSSRSGIARRIGVVARATNGPAGSMIIDRISERVMGGAFLGPCHRIVTFSSFESCLSSNDW